MQWHWPGSIPQRSRSHNTFKGQGTHARDCSIMYVCINGLPSNMVQMLSSLTRCALTLTQIHTSKVKAFKGRSTHARVRSLTYVCIDGLPSNLLQMLSALRWCTVTLTRIHISKVKVTQDIVRCYKTGTHFPSIFSTKKPWH